MTSSKPTKFKMLINCIHKESDLFDKAKEENKIKDKIAKLLYSEGYKFNIVDEEYIK